MRSTAQKRVLITGAAGKIGRVLWRSFKNRYKLRLMFHRTILPVGEGEESVTADITNFETLPSAMEGVDAVVHLAYGGAGGRCPWEQVLERNIIGTYNVFEAARQSGVKKIVFASTNHVTGFLEREGVYTTPEMPIRPDSLYGVSKAFGEALARYYVDQFNMSIICLRIGSFLGKDLPGPMSGRILSTWISNRDIAQLVWRSIEADLPFGIFYGISDNTRRIWDISNARKLLGYAPEDNAENFAANKS